MKSGAYQRKKRTPVTDVTGTVGILWCNAVGRTEMLQAISRQIKGRWSQSGQSLIETALLTPLVLLITFNAVNFGYFFFVALHLTAAPRSGAEYSIQGFATPTAMDLPAPGPSTGSNPPPLVNTVTWLTYQDMIGLNLSGTSTVQVCTKRLGVTAAGSGISKCCNVTSVTATNCTVTGNASAADPEPGHFVINQVDVTYSVAPLIPVQLFGLTLTPSPTFHRRVFMRAMD